MIITSANSSTPKTPTGDTRTSPTSNATRPKIKNSRPRHDCSAQTNSTEDQDLNDKDQKQRIKGSHQGITIRGGRAASGRPGAACGGAARWLPVGVDLPWERSSTDQDQLPQVTELTSPFTNASQHAAGIKAPALMPGPGWSWC